MQNGKPPRTSRIRNDTGIDGAHLRKQLGNLLFRLECG